MSFDGEQAPINMESYNKTQSKIQSSVSFVLGVCGINQGFHHTFLQNRQFFSSDQHLLDGTKDFLLGGWPYRQIALYSFKTMPGAHPFNTIVEILCRHGLYSIGNDDVVLTPKQLEEKPLNLNAHLHFIDMLMKAVCYKIWSPTECVVSSVKRFATFSASKDLPNDSEDAILLWINKVKSKFQQVVSSETHEGMEDWNKNMVTSQLDDLCDSCVLAMLLLYYCTDHIKSEDMVIKDVISIGDALNNLNISLTFCYNKLFPQYDLINFENFLKPEDFLQCPDELRINFFSFYSLLFYCFELDPIKDFVNPKGHCVTYSREAKLLANEEQTAPNIISGSTSRKTNKKEAASQIATLIPEVKSLLSNTTKKSFLPKTAQDINSSNLTTTNSQSDSDLRNVSTHHGIPQRPLLPKRVHDDRSVSQQTNSDVPSPFYKSTSLHNITNGQDMAIPVDLSSKWQRNILMNPYSARSNSGSTATTARDNMETPLEKNIWSTSQTMSTDLLSKVDIESDSEIEEIFSTQGSEEMTSANPTPRSSNIAWGKPSANPASASARSDILNNAGDMTLETVRTLDYKSPAPTSRSSINCDVDETASEFTDVSTMLASGDTALSSLTSRISKSRENGSVGFSEKSPTRSIYRGHPSASSDTTSLSSYGRHSHDATESSYVVRSRAFNTADSARAAGYPIISDVPPTSSINHSQAIPGTTINTNGAISSDERNEQQLLEIIDRMKSIADQIKRQEKERELQHRVLLTEKGQKNMMVLRHMMKSGSSKGGKRDESSSDYSSKSPSPATSARNDVNFQPTITSTSVPTHYNEPAGHDDFGTSSPHQHSQQATFSTAPNNNLAPTYVESPASDSPKFRNLTDDVTLVQQRLDQLQLSVERERHKRKVSALEQSINDLHTELRTLEQTSSAERNSPEHHQDPPSRKDLVRFDSLQPNQVEPGLAEQKRASHRNGDSEKPGFARKNLFAAVSKVDTARPAAQQAPHEVTMSYDSFSCQVQASSCHSTPAKSPLGGSPTNHQDLDDDATLRLQEDLDKKGATGFTILDEKSPATKLARKKEQFLLGRLKKEEEQRLKQMEREMETEKRKKEAREQQELAMLKKQEERQKRDQRLKDYKKRKDQEQEAAFSMQKPGIISSNPASTGKKATKLKSNITEQVEVLENIANFDPPTNSGFSTRNVTHAINSHREVDLESIGSGSSEYSGPKLFKQLTAKSNRALINNALSHCCLPGKVNEAQRLKTLKAIDKSEARHLMVLFRDNMCQYRAIYSYNPDTEKLHKITGHGPTNIVTSMIESLFKYNSGRRTFTCVPSKTLSVSIDAITITNSLWGASNKR